MNENLIAEELNRINLLMGYNLNNTLTENYNNTKKVLIKENRIVGEIFRTESKALMRNATKAELTAAATRTFENMKSYKEYAAARGELNTNKILVDTKSGKAIKNADELLAALKAGTLDASTGMVMAKDLLKNGTSSATRQSASRIIADAKFFETEVQSLGLSTKESLSQHLQKTGYAKAEADMVADEYFKIRGGEVKPPKRKYTRKPKTKPETKPETGSGTGTGTRPGSGTGTGTRPGSGTGTRPGRGGSTITAEGEIMTADGPKLWSELSEQEIKNLSKQDKELYDSYVKQHQAKIDAEIARNKAIEREYRNKSKEYSRSGNKTKGREWLKEKGLIVWDSKLMRWTIRNKWFWLITGGALLYNYWNDVLDFFGIEREDDGTTPPDDHPESDGSSGGDPDDSGNQEQIDWENDPNAGDGEPGDPLLGSYKICGAKVKLGCRDGSSDKIWRLQKCLYIKATGYWGNKTEAAAKGMFDEQQLSDGVNVEQIKERCIY